MKKPLIILLMLLTGFFYQCSESKKNSRDFDTASYQLPKVLVITTGAAEGNGKLAEGVVVAIQSFNRNGALVKLETRDVLNDLATLEKYNILILSSAIDYHDADRQYSLAYMSDYEIDNIKTFVGGGGILIAGDHVGRNYIDGTDRVTIFQKLSPENWGLAECFGVALVERNMKDYRVEGKICENLTGVWMDRSELDLWTLVVDSVYSNSLTELAWWENDDEKVPALLQNNYKRGMTFLLPSSYLIHPANDGGLWSASQIQSFYNYVLGEFDKKHGYSIKLNIWPNAFDYAFCVSLNASGNIAEYERLGKLLDQSEIEPTYFVHDEKDARVKEYLTSLNFSLQSNGFGNIDYQNATYPFVKRDIVDNKNEWAREFSGFRFPYTRPHFSGLLALDELDYKYESSIGADNVNFFNGCVFPYNIPISSNRYYKMTDILEISPIYHDDYYFFESIVKPGIYPPDQQFKDARLFGKYLFNYWEYAVKPVHGLMVFMGHPMYVAHNDTTLKPLENLIAQVKTDNVWLTNLDAVADYWNNLNALNISVEEKDKNVIIFISAPENVKIENLTLNILNKPDEVRVKSGNFQLLEKESKYQLVFNALDGQEVILSY